MENDTRWKYLLCLFINTVNIINMIKFLTVIYRFNEIAINTSMAFFTELENTTLEFIWKHRRSWIAKIIPGKNNSGGIIIPDLHHTIGQ